MLVVLDYLYRALALFKPIAATVPEPEPTAGFSDARCATFRQVGQWVADGYPVRVIAPHNPRIDQALIYSVLKEDRWWSAGHLARATAPGSYGTTYIPTTDETIEFYPVGTDTRQPWEYRQFIKTVETIPRPSAFERRYPIPIPHPDNVTYGKVHVIVAVPDEGLFGDEATRLAEFIPSVRDSCQQDVYYYGMPNLPLTAIAVQQAIDDEEVILTHRYKETENQLVRIQQRLDQLRSTGEELAPADERLRALLIKYPEYDTKRSLRREGRVTHGELDSYGVPRQRSQLGPWVYQSRTDQPLIKGTP